MAEELRGWKDIGAHFGASDRTAQRWERDHGMPVHRTGRTRGASVFALPEELDAWRISPEGLCAGSEGGNGAHPQGATATAVLVPSQAVDAGPTFLRSRKALITVAAAAVLVAAVAVGWLMLARRTSPADAPRRSVPDAYTMPRSSVVFLLKITTANGDPFVFHVLDGGMATIAVRGGTKLGFVPARSAGTAKLVVVELTPLRPAGERILELKRFTLVPRSRIHFDHPGMSVDVEWTDTLKSSDLPAAPPDSPRKCCVICGDVTACAAQASAPCGTCCGFGGCMGAAK